MYFFKAEKLADIPSPCKWYASMGCAFVLNIQVVNKAKSSWANHLNTTSRKIKNEYMKPIDDSVQYIAHYTSMISSAISYFIPHI